jgi:leucyl/phenylalanyl-tRNA--protein transferase
MFAKKSNASKVAFVTLVGNLFKLDYHFLDCQVTTEHLKRLGAKEVTRKKFLGMLKSALQ